MATTRKTFKTISAGTDVTWHYRSAIGHPGRPAVVHHSGKALTRARKSATR